MIVHTPVMLKEVCEYMPKDTKLIVDCTLWHGGHAIALLSIAQEAKLIGFDVDELMMNKAKQIIENAETNPSGFATSPWHGRKYEENLDSRIEYVHGNYADIVSVLDGRKADYILNDLGVNLEHFKDVERGFSIRGAAPLDMRFDTSKGTSAADLVRTYSIDQLKNIFEIYADFSSPKALEIAKHIVTTKKQKPIETTQDLKLVLNDCGLGDKACTVIFQSIRIEVNHELDNLQRFLSEFPKVMNSAWRCCMITYHSTEDRFVKQAFRELVATWEYLLVQKKAIMPNYKEVAKNRAARSAKIRILEKL